MTSSALHVGRTSRVASVDGGHPGVWAVTQYPVLKQSLHQEALTDPIHGAPVRATWVAAVGHASPSRRWAHPTEGTAASLLSLPTAIPTCSPHSPPSRRTRRGLDKLADDTPSQQGSRMRSIQGLKQEAQGKKLSLNEARQFLPAFTRGSHVLDQTFIVVRPPPQSRTTRSISSTNSSPPRESRDRPGTSTASSSTATQDPDGSGWSSCRSVPSLPTLSVGTLVLLLVAELCGAPLAGGRNEHFPTHPQNTAIRGATPRSAVNPSQSFSPQFGVAPPPLHPQTQTHTSPLPTSQSMRAFTCTAIPDELCQILYEPEETLDVVERPWPAPLADALHLILVGMYPSAIDHMAEALHSDGVEVHLFLAQKEVILPQSVKDDVEVLFMLSY
ncbi:hypothetical protein JB92DRAFT_3115263 [Gautieria morchelliformis]|nr:hypothetical protein JB92DRAFT_3115263 [Gautieria morchelliformis]